MSAEDHGAPHARAAGQRYLPELDGLRAIACTLVILYHAGPMDAFSGGFIGVDIFFVLSAFLITSILAAEWERTGTIRIASFYWRRVVRLVPAFLLLLGVYVWLAPYVWPGQPHLRDALLAGLYLTDYSYTLFEAPSVLRHTWSLAVEEKFYLIWPLLLVPLLRARRPLLVLAALWAAFTCWRLAWSHEWTLYYFRFDTRFTGLIAGALLFFLLRSWRVEMRPAYAYCAAAVLAGAVLLATIRESALVITLAELMAAIVIACLVQGRGGWLGRLLRNDLLVALGKLSYGMYLWHFPTAYLLRSKTDLTTAFTVSFLFALVAASISYWTVEALGRMARTRRSPRAPREAAASS